MSKRRTQASRSEEMRARLSQAAYEVIAERGHSSFRTAAVAEHAGVSEGALLHHFPNKAAVTMAAIDFALSQAKHRTLKVIDGLPDDEQIVLDAMFKDFHNFFHGDNFWVALDISMDAQKASPAAREIRAIVTDLRGPVFQSWHAKLIRSGFPAQNVDLAVLSAATLVSGLAIRTLWTTDDKISPQLSGLWRGFVGQLATH